MGDSLAADLPLLFLASVTHAFPLFIIRGIEGLIAAEEVFSFATRVIIAGNRTPSWVKVCTAISTSHVTTVTIVTTRAVRWLRARINTRAILAHEAT